MLFSTKAEYGVRLMVELGRQPGSTPVSLSAVAEAERLPLSYLEHLVAKLRKAGPRHLDPRRPRRLPPGAAGRGDHDARGRRGAGGADRADGVLPRDARGQGLCSHETDGDHACATKLLWTRVQGGVTKALAGTTLAELVEFAEPSSAPKRRRRVGSAA